MLREQFWGDLLNNKINSLWTATLGDILLPEKVCPGLTERDTVPFLETCSSSLVAMSQVAKGGAFIQDTPGVGARMNTSLACLAVPGSQQGLSARTVKTAGRAFNGHCKYYRCRWYAEKQEEQHLLLPGGRRTNRRAGEEELEGCLGEKGINKTSLVCTIYCKQPTVVWSREKTVNTDQFFLSDRGSRCSRRIKMAAG